MAKSDDKVAALAAVFRAAADPTRLRILALLGEGGDVCVCHIYESLRISQTKASRHLAYLRRSGLVAADKRGLWVYYRLAPARSEAVGRVLKVVREEVARATIIASDRVRLSRLTARDGARPSDAVPCCAAPADTAGV